MNVPVPDLIVPGADLDLIQKHIKPGHGPADQWKHSPTGKRGKRDLPGGNGRSRSPSPSPKAPRRPAKSDPDVVRTDDIEVAAQALIDGKKVELTQRKQVSTLLDRLAKWVNDEKNAGRNAKPLDLCNVTVKGTNLFCSQAIVKAKRDKSGAIRGARYWMPQLKAVPTPGSRASKLKPDEKGEVDIQPLFKKFLASRGIKIDPPGTEKAAYLKATQQYLQGNKVAGMKQAMTAGKLSTRSAPIFISNDNYIVDGHHRWAAAIGLDFADNKEGDIDMDVERIDMPMTELIGLANDFADEWGMPRVEKTLFSFTRPCPCETEFDRWVAQAVEQHDAEMRVNGWNRGGELRARVDARVEKAKGKRK